VSNERKEEVSKPKNQSMASALKRQDPKDRQIRDLERALEKSMGQHAAPGDIHDLWFLAMVVGAQCHGQNPIPAPRGHMASALRLEKQAGMLIGRDGRFLPTGRGERAVQLMVSMLNGLRYG
jgi:hypothetical protein